MRDAALVPSVVIRQKSVVQSVVQGICALPILHPDSSSVIVILIAFGESFQ